MKCRSCGTENSEENIFCTGCGSKLGLICPACGAEYSPGDNFCGKCGTALKEISPRETEQQQDLTRDPVPDTQTEPGIPRSAGGERRNITVFFSDLAGYTAMSEILDPEETREIMSKIFGETARIVAKYEGYIDKFIGDAVMVLFGFPKAHEDDPVRAVRTAMELHEFVERLSPEIEKKIGNTLRMHTGINTGMVVTGEIDLEKGTERVLGDTINVASRMTSLAAAGEIITGETTYHLAEGYFHFEKLQPTRVKGKSEAVKVYRAVSPRERPVTIHHLSGLKSELIGRSGEMAQLHQAVRRLYEGKGTVVAITGEAGTGKSRLVLDFKAGLDLKTVQWREAHSYAYSGNMPYFQLKNLFSRTWNIEESDQPETIGKKIETGISRLLGDAAPALPYIGSLYSLNYPEIDDLDPQFRKTKLIEYIREILSALCKQGPTILYLEDLHWADPSSVALLKAITAEFQYPAVFLCVYRPEFALFSSNAIAGMGDGFMQIDLRNLSYSETQAMLESLLESKQIPPELVRFIQEKVEGYPLYLEEVINTLIESGMLVNENGVWSIRGKIEDLDIPTTIHGIITARLDLLEQEPKRIIQEASVIGRVFFYDILRKVSDLKQSVDTCLRSLEMVDLIRTRALTPDIEYIFKHALTQEVIYNSILKKERQILHEKIACVIEQLFGDRLSEFYETLAFHYKNGQSRGKAVDYLLKSAEKSVRRYAVEEAHLYYGNAFEIIKSGDRTAAGYSGMLLDIIIAWCWVYYFRGDFGNMHKLLISHEPFAESSEMGERKGKYFAWLGFSFYFQDEQKKSYEILQKALKMGEECGSAEVAAHALAWLCYPCYELGRYHEGIAFGEKGLQIVKEILNSDYLYLKSIAGIDVNANMLGQGTKIIELGRELLEYSKIRSNTRCTVVGHICIGYGNQNRGYLSEAIESMKRAVETSIDPFYTQWPRFVLGLYYIWNGQIDEAEEAVKDVIAYCEQYDCKVFLYASRPILGAVLMARGELGKGLRILESGLTYFREHGRLYFLQFTEFIIGKIYRMIAEGEGRVGFASAVKNLGFIASQVPFAAKKAEEHYLKAIETAEQTGAVFVKAIASLDLARLYHAKKKPVEAKKYLDEAAGTFKTYESEGFLEQSTQLREAINTGKQFP